jgi:hypothetical protein
MPTNRGLVMLLGMSLAYLASLAGMALAYWSWRRTERRSGPGSKVDPALVGDVPRDPRVG